MQRRQVIKGIGCCALAGGGVSAAFGGPLASDGNTVPYAWNSVPFGGGGFAAGFVFHPREAGLLYARTDVGGAYRFDAAAKRWIPLLDHLSLGDAELMGVLSLAVDPHDPDRLYAACGQSQGQWSRKAALLSSADRGENWSLHELDLKLGGFEAGRGSGERLQVDPNDGNVLLLGTSSDGLMMSADRGRTFRRLDFPAKHVSLVLFDAADGARGAPSRTIYAGSHDKPGLYVSGDGGKTFTRETGTPEQAPQRAALAPDGTLYVCFAQAHGDIACNPGNAKSGSVWKREPKGQWTDITPVSPGKVNQTFGYSGLDVDRQVPGRVVVSTFDRWSEGDDLFLSVDGGGHWTPMGARSRHQASSHAWLLPHYMRGNGRMGHQISDVKIDPFNSDRALYGTGFGVFLTENLRAAQQQGGQVDWEFAVGNLEVTVATEIKSPSEGASLLVGMNSVSGAAWDNVSKSPNTGLFAPFGETNRSVDHAELSPMAVVRTSEQAATGGYVSLNGAMSWRPFGPSPRTARAPNGDYLGVGRVAISAKGGFLVWAPDRQPALWSADLGKTWKEVQGWPLHPEMTMVPVADRTIEGIFYVHDRATGRILISVDGGASFKPVITGIPELRSWQGAQLVCAPGTVRDLWLALPDALLYFAGPDKRGRTIKHVAEPWLVAVGKAAPGATYHSLYVWGKVRVGSVLSEGLFRSDDVGASFKRINDDRHRYGRLVAMAADPLEHGKLFIAPQGRGVIVGRPAA